MAKQKFYAVAAGRTTGIFTSWGVAEAQVKGYGGARYKSFATRDEAQKWLADGGAVAKKAAKPAAKATSRTIPTPQAIPEGGLLIYTDGGAINNPGPGGYGIVIVDGAHRRELSGGFRLTTNNRMELTACLVALREAAGSGRPIVLYSDSSYLVNGIEKGWVRSWRRRGWRKADSTPALNVDLWSALLELLDHERVEFRWVRGHAGNELNERCDQLAVSAARTEAVAIDHGYEDTLDELR